MPVSKSRRRCEEYARKYDNVVLKAYFWKGTVLEVSMIMLEVSVNANILCRVPLCDALLSQSGIVPPNIATATTRASITGSEASVNSIDIPMPKTICVVLFVMVEHDGLDFKPHYARFIDLVPVYAFLFAPYFEAS